ncbi:Dimethylamine dehydrogenase [Labeo rohita]|uniref:Dimethylamine dehydrogenase n=1 Tax=Labeo rohita TaxID=84645 RepID=A0ABQ8L1F0_LABRO|nr:Dimethylamine dehydrogenase [Labeo rohita]
MCASPPDVPSQAAVQNAHFETHPFVRSTPGLVCNHRPEGHVLSRLDFASTQTLSTVCFRGSSVSVQGAPIWPVPVPPRLYEGRGGGPEPALAEGHSHPQLSRRLAHHGSLARSVVRTKGPGAPAPQPSGPSGQPREEQTLPSAEDLFSRHGAGLDQYDSLPHQRAHAVSAELSEIFQAQNSGPSQNILEAPGAYGSRSRSNAARPASYETASALATRSSPEMGMAPWHTPDWRFPAVSPPIQPVVRPCLPTGRSSLRTGLQACCGSHGCLHHGLGCCMQRASSLGLLDRTSTALAHQLPGVASSASRAASLSSDAPPQARACPHGQHCDRSVHQPSRWSTLPSYVATRPPSAPVESDAAEIAARRSHTRGAQPCSRSALTAAHPLWRMATPPPDSPADLESIRRGPDRSVCLPRILPLPALLLPQRGSPRQGRTGTQLDCLGPKYAFPPVSLFAQTLCKIREDGEQVLLVAPYWPTRTWFVDLTLLATALPWKIPLRKDLLSQGMGTIWHPRPDLWNLHVWLLDGTR